jgi:hypothetical protein
MNLIFLKQNSSNSSTISGDNLPSKFFAVFSLFFLTAFLSLSASAKISNQNVFALNDLPVRVFEKIKTNDSLLVSTLIVGSCPGATFATIQSAVSAAASGDTIQICAGTYDEDVSIGTSNLIISGAGAGSTNVRGVIGGGTSTFAIGASNVEIKNLTITRLGNNTTDWNNPGLNSAGISIQGTSISGASIHDNIITGNRTGIDVNNSNGHTIRNNVIDFNRTGLIFRNQTDNLTVVENFITNNWTGGIVFLDGSGGTNSPVQTALNCKFRNNNISANWYAQIVERQSGGSLPAPGTNRKDFRVNWLGTTSPVVTTANSAEPGYAAQIPVAYGGTATPPGGQPDIAGPASANFRTSPILTSGTDTNVETMPGRGTFGFQGTPLSFNLTPAAAPTANDNDYTRINDAIQLAASGSAITLNGTFNWTETNAAASWALGSDGTAGTDDDYSIKVPADLNGVTFTANNLGDATIQGPGDLQTVAFEGVFYFDGSGDNQNWTISKIRFLDFDWTIQMYNGAGGGDSYNNTQIINNYIRMPQDLAVASNSDEVDFQNVAIHYSFGTNQLISGNTIDIPGNSLSDTANNNYAANIGMQCNTSGGAVYNNLQITNNTINVLNAQSADPEVVIGIWENAHGHSSNITVSGNQFLNLAGGNNPSLNLQRGFRVTSHSSGSTTVEYSNNQIVGANIGFQWLSGQNFAGNQPVKLTSNAILNNQTGVLVQSLGSANLSFNRIVGNSVAGVNNVDGAVNAENNWWGCNYGPGVGGAGCAGTANGIIGTIDSNPWLTLRTSASPNAVITGGMSSVSSNLNFNSDNVNTSGLGSVPNGTPASFAGTLGTVAPTTGSTTSGAVGTTFTAGAVAGSGNAQTTIDGQTVSAPINITFSCNNVSIPTGNTVLRNNQFVVPINVDSTNGRGILSYDFTLTYNPAVVSFVQIETAGTLSSGWTITSNSISGTLVVSGYNTAPLSGSGALLNLRFTATGAIGTTSALNLTAFQFNEGIPCVNTTNGDVTIISGTVGGTITYSNAPTTTPVPFTTINAAGSTPLSTMTDSNGNYSLSGFGAGAYTVTPSKNNQVNGISNLDASRIAQHIVGLITLNSTQLIAADVTANGTISSLDAAYIAQFVALVPNPGITGTWKFIPPNRMYPNVESNFTGQDYGAILMGEVTGNWNPNGALRPSKESVKEKTEQIDNAVPVVTVTAPPMQLAHQNAPQNSDFTIPLLVSETAGTGAEAIFGYQFNLFYTVSVISPQANPCDLSGTLSSNLSVVCNPIAPGQLNVVVFGATALSGSGTLMKLKFSVVPGAMAGATSPLTIQDFMFNEGTPMDVTVDGSVRIVGPTTAAVAIEGYLTSATGQGVSKATVELTGTNGETRTALSNNFGYYRFENVTVGETYVVSVRSKRYTFTPLTISPTDGISGLNLIAEP